MKFPDIRNYYQIMVKVRAALSIVFGVVISIAFIWWFAWMCVKTENKCIEEYKNKVNSHCVEIHFKDGNVKRFDKNFAVEIDSTKPFKKGELLYVLRPSGTKIPYDIVKYAEVKEMK